MNLYGGRRVAASVAVQTRVVDAFRCELNSARVASEVLVSPGAKLQSSFSSVIFSGSSEVRVDDQLDASEHEQSMAVNVTADGVNGGHLEDSSVSRLLAGVESVPGAAVEHRRSADRDCVCAGLETDLVAFIECSAFVVSAKPASAAADPSSVSFVCIV